jgi:hypothetical protein
MKKSSNQINIVLSDAEMAQLEKIRTAQQFDTPRQTIARAIFQRALAAEAQKVGRRAR